MLRRGRNPFWLLPLFCVIATPQPVFGQDLAAAEALFKKGIADLEAGKYDTACPALAESNRLDPRAGTLFAVADCRDKQGRIATAVALYEDYLRGFGRMSPALKLRHNERAKIAKARKAALASEVPELTLAPPKDAPDDVKVTRDGTVFSNATFGVSLPVDPGEHVIEVQVGDGPVHTQRITIQRKEKKTVVLEVGPAPSPEATATSVSPATSVAPTTTSAPLPAVTAPPSGEAQGGGMGGQRIGAIILAGVGLAGVGLGAAMGATVLDKKGIIDEHCPQKACDEEGKAALADVQIPGLISTIGLGVGAAGLVGAAVLWLTAPKSQTPDKKGSVKNGSSVTGSLDISPNGVAVSVKGAF